MSFSGLSKKFTNLKVIQSIGDFPSPSSGIISLEDDTAYLIDGNIDLGSNRLSCGNNNALLGHTPEISVLHNNLASQPMITGDQTINIYDLTLYVEGASSTILDLDASTSPDVNNAIDWRNVNFSGGDIGTIANYSNAIFNTIGIIDKTDEGFPSLGNGFAFDGTIGSIVFTDTIFSAFSTGTTAISLEPTLTLSRRFRATDCAFVVLTGCTGLDVSSSATIDPEGVILANCNFSGSGTYLDNIDYTDDVARFNGCRGIVNTYAAGYLTMNGNATATVISSSSTPVKVSGTTTGQSVSQKFDVITTDNRATYTGALDRLFKVTVIASLSSGNNNEIGIYIAKNGSVITESQSFVTTNSGGRLENGTCQTISQTSTDDYFEVWVENRASTNNITVEDLSLIISEE